MNHTRHKGAIGIILLVIALILVVGIGIYAAMFHTKGTTATSTPSTVSTSTSGASGTDPYANTSAWQLDSRPDSGFSISYPIDFAVADNTTGALSTDWRLYADGHPGTKAFELTVPKSFEPNTNFSEAKLSVGWSADAKAVAACLAVDPSPVSATTSRATISGVAFTVYPYSDAGAGNLYQGRSYRAVHGGKCYAIEYVIHSTQLANYPASYGLTAFDQGKIESLMDRIIGTFSFI